MIIVNIKKVKEQKKSVLKQRLMFEIYINCLFKDIIILKSKGRF